MTPSPRPTHSTATGESRRASPLRLAILAIAMALAPLARAQSAVVVLGGDSEPYRLAGQACVDSLRAKGLTATIKPLAAADRPADALYVAVGARAAAALMTNSAPDTAVVYCMVSQPEAAALPKHDRATGVTTTVPPAEQFGLIRSILPKARKIGVLARASSGTSTTLLQTARTQLPEGWELIEVDLDSEDSEAAAIGRLMSAGIDAVWTIPDPAVYDGAVVKALLLAALRSTTPVFGFSSQVVKAGAIAGVGIDPADQGRQAAELVGQIAETPSHIPATRAPTFQTSVNLIVAEKLGVEIPKPIQADAKQVYR
ncbi:MAG: hypothetical protein IPJ41_02910 [Phycisphaerales bacterium]|nr:hypothetical protein [Phycisphaerales bacterium]